MLFNSGHFLLFFPVVVTAYFALPHSKRWLLLLGASCYFYMTLIPEYILVLFFLIAVDFVAAILIEKSAGATRRALLVLSLCANISILGTFKYYDFIATNVGALLALFGVGYSPNRLGMALPIGLSFHTFQSMSYTIEVYRGQQRAERHLGIYALYVLFFPQMVAGPIERPQNLLHQFRLAQTFSYARVTAGLQLMLWGFFKKVVIADRLSAVVDAIYSDPHQYSGFQVLFATYSFSLQIYCDFSGYSDIALGCSQVLGINLMKNFDRPYASATISEFWRRWHISLSTWFRDYVYIPLGGNKGGLLKRSLNLFIVFALSGLWHGANWTFLAWGALHGLLLVTGLLRREMVSATEFGGRFASARKILGQLLTFHLVLLGWVFFRARTMSDATFILTRLFTLPYGPLDDLKKILPTHELAAVLLSLVVLALVEVVGGDRDIRAVLLPWPRWMKWGASYALLLLILLTGRYGSATFIYFQF